MTDVGDISFGVTVLVTVTVTVVEDIELEEDDEELVVPSPCPWLMFDCRISRNIMAPSTAFGHIYR